MVYLKYLQSILRKLDANKAQNKINRIYYILKTFKSFILAKIENQIIKEYNNLDMLIKKFLAPKIRVALQLFTIIQDLYQ